MAYNYTIQRASFEESEDPKDLVVTEDVFNLRMTLSDTMLDCLIVGGGIAGLSAGLALGRARRKTLICSDGLPRNAPARHSHNFLTRDGAFPLELQAIARQQLEPYTSVSILDFEAKCVERSPDGSFVALLGNDTRVMSRTVILATGIISIC